MIRYLTDEWVELNRRLCEKLLPKQAGVTFRMQVTNIDVPRKRPREIECYSIVRDGLLVDQGIGVVRRPDVRLRVPYVLQVQMQRDEVQNLLPALLTGEVQVDGSLRHLEMVGVWTETAEYREVKRLQLSEVLF